MSSLSNIILGFNKVLKIVRQNNYMKLFVHWDLLSHYSLELLFINIAIGAFYHPFSVGERWWSELWPRAWVVLEIW